MSLADQLGENDPRDVAVLLHGPRIVGLGPHNCISFEDEGETMVIRVPTRLVYFMMSERTSADH